MDPITNHSNEITAAYITAGVSIVVAIITIIGTLIVTKKSRSNAIEVERLKQQFDLSNEYKKKKIEHMGRLLNLVYNIRVASMDINRNLNELSLQNLLKQTQAFETFYRNNVDKTNLLNEIVRSYAHDTFQYQNTLIRYTELNFLSSHSEQILSTAHNLYIHSKAYESFLRDASKEEIEIH